jgi:uncharacterized protein YciI
MQYFVLGVDNAAAAERLELVAEAHWAYMDGYVDELVARGPTLSPDGEAHTGSVHVLAAGSAEEAHRFAFREPYSLAAAFDVGVEQASAIVAGAGLPELTAPMMTCRWQRGGRNQE